LKVVTRIVNTNTVVIQKAVVMVGSFFIIKQDCVLPAEKQGAWTQVMEMEAASSETEGEK